MLAFIDHLLREQEEDFVLPKPRSALQTAKVILASTQRLKITTIDSIFYEWVTRFPSEAKVDEGVDRAFERNVNLTESHDFEELNKNAWEEIFRRKSLKDKFFKAYNQVKEFLPKIGVLGVQGQVEELFRYLLHIFYLQKKQASVFLTYDGEKSQDLLPKTPEQVLAEVKDDLLTIAEQIKNKNEILNCLNCGKLSDLLKCRLLTANYSVSKILVKGTREMQSVLKSLELKKFSKKMNIDALSLNYKNRAGAFSSINFGIKLGKNLSRKKKHL